MAETNYTPIQVVQKLTETLKERLKTYEGQVQELRTRELQPREGKLEKHELCPLCGGADRNGVCDCLTLKKNAVMGYPQSTPGSGAPSNTGLGSMGGGGTQPMAMGEKDAGGKCSMCGESVKDFKAHNASAHKFETEDRKKNPKDPIFGMKKAVNGEGDGGMTGVAGLDKNCGPKDMKKDYGAGVADTGSLSKSGVNDPGRVAAVNQEMGGFRSLAHNPVHAAQGAGMKVATPPALAPKRRPLHEMGRGTVSAGGMTAHGANVASGTIPNAKSEDKNYGSARSPYGTGANGHATQTNMPSALKENMATTKSEVQKAEMSKPYAAKVGITDHRNKAKAAYGDGPHDQRPAMHQAQMGVMNSASPALPAVRKDEKEMAATPAAPEKAAKGTKLPKVGKSVDAKKTGAGGQIKGNPLRKDAMAAEKPEVKGVGGKQPVGQGGGDAPKFPAAKPMNTKLPPPKGSASNLAKKPDALRAAGSAEVGRLIGNKQAAMAPVDVVVPRQPDALDQARAKMQDAAQLRADKKAGGVGFLNNLISMFSRKPAANPAVEAAAKQLGGNRSTTAVIGTQGGTTVKTFPAGTPTGPVKSQRFHGAMPLQRSEMAMKKASLAMSKMGKCPGCNQADHAGMCKGLSAMNHTRTMLSVKPTKSKKSR